MLPFETERLTVAQVGAKHAGSLLAYYRKNRTHLERWEPSRPPDFYTLGYFESYVAYAMDEAVHERSLHFVASLRGSVEVMAAVNVHEIQHGSFLSATLGYSVDGTVQGRGYGKEAVGAVVDWFFLERRMHRLAANYQPSNERSGRLLRALGFNVEGYARDYLYIDGAWRDHILTARVHSERKQP